MDNKGQDMKEKVCNIDKNKIYCSHRMRNNYMIYCFHNDLDKKLYLCARQKSSEGQYFFGIDFEPDFCPFCGFSYQPERLNEKASAEDAKV